jgi:hypothetical protein
MAVAHEKPHELHRLDRDVIGRAGVDLDARQHHRQFQTLSVACRRTGHLTRDGLFLAILTGHEGLQDQGSRRRSRFATPPLSRVVFCSDHTYCPCTACG